MSFYASGGAVLSLPCAGDFSNSDWHHVIWQADGAGSVLALPGLTSLSYAGGYGGVSVEALSGGQILLTNLAAIGGGDMSVSADRAGSLVDLSGLRQIPVIWTSLPFQQSNGGQILLPRPVDFVVTGIALPGAALAGQFVPIAWSVANQGLNDASGTRADGIWLSPDGRFPNANNIFVGNVVSPSNLAPGASQTLTNTIIIPSGLNGSYFLVVQADNLHQFYEGFAAKNNALVSTNPMAISAPDLVVTSFSTTNTNVRFGAGMWVSWVVRNQGAVDANALWYDRVYLSRTPNVTAQSRLLAGQSLPRGPLPAGQSYTNYFAVTLPLESDLEAGSYYLVAMADQGNALAESNENNNTAAIAVSVTYPQLPDLQAGPCQAPATALPGQTVPVVWSVTNIGATTASGPWMEAVTLTALDTNGMSGLALDDLLNPAASVLLWLTVTNDLAPGAGVVRTQVVTMPITGPAGTLKFAVGVDPQGAVVEATKTNNLVLADAPTWVPLSLALQLPTARIPENAANPALTALISRNGDGSGPLTVQLTTSDASRLATPTNVTILANENAASVPLTVFWDHAPGADQAITLTATAAGFSTATATVTVVNVDTPALSIALSALSVIEGGSVTGRVSRSFVSDQPLAVMLSSSSAAHLAVTNLAVIPAGATDASFTVQAVDDWLIEPPRSYSILASAPGYAGAGASLLVLDDDIPSLSLDVSATNVMENAGPLALTGKVRRSFISPRAVNVLLTSSNTNALVAPVTVTIPASLDTVSFPIGAVNNTTADGARTVILSAQTLDDFRGDPIGDIATQAITVLDDDSPGLAVAIAPKIVPAGVNPAIIATIARNTPATNDLVVRLSASDPASVSLPATVLLPLGASSVSVFLTNLVSSAATGDRTITIAADADGLASGSDTLVISDGHLPDLVVTSMTAPVIGQTGENFSFGFRVENRGLASTTNAIVERVFLVTNPYARTNAPLMDVVFTGAITNGGFFDRTLSSQLPQTPGDYWVIVVADATDVVRELNEDNNVAVSPAPIHVSPAYSAVVQANPHNLPSAGPVTLSGQATKANGGPAIGVLVNVHLGVRGFERVISAITDGTGNFSTTFTPRASEAGHYYVGATHPSATTWTPQDEFTVLGAKFDPALPAVSVLETGSVTNQVDVANLADVPLTQLAVTVASNSPNLSVAASLSAATLPALGHATLTFAVTATGPSPSDALVVLHLASQEGATMDLPIAVNVRPLAAQLVAQPASLVAGMLRGGATTVQFDVVNQGTAASGPINLSTPALDWMRVSTANPMASLAPGATNRVTLQLLPPSDLPLGPYQGNLTLLTSNQSVSLPFNFRALSEATGELAIQTADEMTLYSAGAPGVTNALVILADAVTGAGVLTNLTGADGTLLLTNVPEAYYQVTITATNHAAYHATILLLAGQTNQLSAFLPYEAVQYVWKVVPTELEDRTRLVVETTFQTFVPVPQIEIIPSVVDLLDYANGGQILVTITNHGWIAAQEMHYHIPAHPCWQIQPMTEDLGSLPAFSSVTIPVTVHPQGSGPVCSPCEFVGELDWKVYAANLTNSYSAPQFFINAGQDCGTPAVPVVGHDGGGGGVSFSGPIINVSTPPCCAVNVKLRIDQDSVITRDAFTASLELENGSGDPLALVGVNVEIRDSQGAIVNGLFGLHGPVLDNLDAVDGTGMVPAGLTGSATWTFIPTSDAAPTNEVDYLVGGTLTYAQGGTPLRIPLTPTTIRVLPNAALQVSYFMQRDVFGDDPFTPDVVEPSEPFALAVMLKNVGYGAARNVRITSAKPTIVDNVSGLYVFFDILATEVAGQDLTPSLTASFGDLAPGQIRAAKWLFTSNVQGLFVDYAASFEHLDGLGDPRLSLIQSVSIHEMIHLVTDSRPEGSALPSYLVHDSAADTNDWRDLPDTLYLSDGRVEPVSAVTTVAVSSAVAPAALQVALTASLPSGWSYLCVPDPQGASGDRQYRLARVQRSDGTDLPAANFWQTDRTFLGHFQRPLAENTIHLLDFNSSGQYKLTYVPIVATDTVPPTSNMRSLPAHSYPNFILQWSGLDNPGGSGIAYYNIYASTNGAAFAPLLTNTPATATLFTGQWGNTYAFFSIATDLARNTQPWPATPDAVTFVDLTNLPPVLSLGGDQTVDEGTTVVINSSATDPNTEQLLTFSLGAGAPANAAIDSRTGRVAWPTDESTGPSANVFTVIVADNGIPPLSATGQVMVIVREVNQPPVLAPIADATIDEGELLLITNVVTDPDLPRNHITFSLGPGAPDGAAIDATTGLFRWQPNDLQGPSTNLIAVIATDDGQPPLSATRQFTVIVRDVLSALTISLGSTNLMRGETSSVPITLISSADLTGVGFTINLDPTQITNLAVRGVAAEAKVDHISTPGGQHTFWFTLDNTLRTVDQRVLAWLDFQAVPQTHSALLPLRPSPPTATRASGLPVGTTDTQGGIVVIVGAEPVLTATRGTPLAVTLYGSPPQSCVLQTAAGLVSPQWQDQMTLTLTNRSLTFTPPGGSGNQAYFRVVLP